MNADLLTIINEELAESGIQWVHLVLGKTRRIITKTRWRIIYRAKTELKLPTNSIAQELGLDGTSVRNALDKMLPTNGEYFDKLGPVSPKRARETMRILNAISTLKPKEPK